MCWIFIGDIQFKRDHWGMDQWQRASRRNQNFGRVFHLRQDRHRNSQCVLYVISSIQISFGDEWMHGRGGYKWMMGGGMRNGWLHMAHFCGSEVVEKRNISFAINPSKWNHSRGQISVFRTTPFLIPLLNPQTTIPSAEVESAYWADWLTVQPNTWGHQGASWLLPGKAVLTPAKAVLTPAGLVIPNTLPDT